MGGGCNAATGQGRDCVRCGASNVSTPPGHPDRPGRCTMGRILIRPNLTPRLKGRRIVGPDAALILFKRAMVPKAPPGCCQDEVPTSLTQGRRVMTPVPEPRREAPGGGNSHGLPRPLTLGMLAVYQQAYSCLTG